MKYWLTRLGGLSLPRKSVVMLTDRPDMTFDVYRGRKKQQHNLCMGATKKMSELLPLNVYPETYKTNIMPKLRQYILYSDMETCLNM